MGHSLRRRILGLTLAVFLLLSIAVSLFMIFPVDKAQAFTAYEKVEIQLKPNAHFYQSTSPESAKSMLTFTVYVNAADPTGEEIEDSSLFDLYVNDVENGRFQVGSNSVYVKYNPQGTGSGAVQSNTLTVNADNATVTEIVAKPSSELKTDVNGDYYYEQDGKPVYVFLYENPMSTYERYIEVTVNFDKGGPLTLTTDEFDLSGNLVEGICQLTVGGISGTNKTGTVTLKITNKKLTSIEATFNQTAPIPSSNEQSLKTALARGTYGAFTVKGTYNDGTTATLNSRDYAVIGDLHSADSAEFTVNLTVQGVGLSSETKTTVNNVLIQPSVPAVVTFNGQLKDIQTAFEEVDPSGDPDLGTSGIIMIVTYGDGKNKIVNLSSSLKDHYTVTYFDKEGTEQPDRDPNTLRVGDTAVKFHYTEGGQKFDSQEFELPQNIIPATIDRLQFDNSTEKYDPEKPDERIIQGYDAGKMSVENATSGGTNTLQIDCSGDGEIRLIGTGAGTYKVSITLNENYVWREGGGGTVSEDGRTLTFEWVITKIVAKPVLTIKGWEYGQTGSPELSGDFDEGAEITYHYSGRTNAGETYGPDNPDAPTQAGSYKVYVVIGESANYTGGQSDSVEFNITKKQIDSPKIPSKEYTGKPLKAEISDTDIYTVTENNGGTEAGAYDVELTLKDTFNTEWKDEVAKPNPTITLEFNITQATNVWETEVSFGGWTYGQYNTELKPAFKAKFGGETAKIEYFTDSDGTGSFTPSNQTNAGRYYVKVTIAATDNYSALDSGYVEFSVNKAQISEPTEDLSEFTYNRTEQTYNPVGFNPSTMDIDGNKQTNANEEGYTVTVTVKDTTNYEWAGGGNEPTTFTFIIYKLEIGFTPGETEFTYNGSLQTPSATPTGVIEGDSITLTVSGGQTDANEGKGPHIATVTGIEGASADNYKLPANTKIEFNIARATLDKPTENSEAEFTYNGTERTYTPVGFNPSTMDIDGNKQTNANEEGYTVTVSIENTTNYKWADGTDTAVVFENAFIIHTATLSITWTKTEETYSGEAWEPEYEMSGWCGEDQGLYTPKLSLSAVSGSLTDGKAINAGTYNVVLSFERNDGGVVNYVLENAETKFTIVRKKIDVQSIVTEPSGIPNNGSLNDRRIPFTGEKISLVITENPDVYTIGEIPESVSVGRYYITLTFTQPNNYQWYNHVDNSYGTDEIVEEDGTIKLWYDITEQQFTLTVTITEKWTYGDNENVTPSVGESNLTGNDPVYTYYDARGEKLGNEMPKDAGSYYVEASVKAGNGYAATTSQKVMFTIEKREITIAINADNSVYGSWEEALVNFTISGNVDSAYAINYQKIENKDIKLIYTPSGDVQLVDGLPRYAGVYSVSAEFSDTQNNFTISVEGQTFTIEALELSEISWDNASFEYSGKAQQPYVNGFNSQYGDTVDGLKLNYEITGGENNQAVNAGNYTVKVISVGNPNYKLPEVVSEQFSKDFIVKPKTITVTFTYDGGTYGNANGTSWTAKGLVEGEDQAVLRGTITYSGSANDGTPWNYDEPSKSHAGEYTITLHIENGNYCFADGKTEFTSENPLVVKKYTINSITWTERDFTYDGTHHNYTNLNLAIFEGVNGDGPLALDLSANGGFTDAGRYVITASLTEGQKYNYELGTVQAQKEYIISPAKLTVSWTKTEETYSGKGWKPVYSISDGSWFGDKDSYSVSMSVSGALTDGQAVNAGTYNATLSLESIDDGVMNYVLEGADIDFTIKRKIITVEFDYDGGMYGSANGTSWTAKGLVEGEEQTVLGGKITYSEGAYDGTPWNYDEPSKSHAGEYIITLTITNGNYCFADGKTEFTAGQPLVVKKYTINSVTWAERDFTYNGKSQDDGNFATFTGVNGDGTLNLTETIKQNEEITEFINAGRYTFTASLTTEQAYNYEFAAGVNSAKTYEIDKAPLAVSWTKTEETYNGKTWVPEYEVSGWFGGDEGCYSFPMSVSGVKVTGSQAINAGTYNAILSLVKNDGGVMNYVLSNAEKQFEILKRDITLAFDASIQYGETLPAFERRVYTERIISGTYAEGEDFSDLGIEVGSVSSSDYRQGNGADKKYSIQWTQSGVSENYNVTCADGVLTVTKRKVAIEIIDAESVYGKPLSELMWRPVSGSIYNNEEIFILHIDKKGSVEEHLAAGTYAIYGETTALAANYELTFKGSWQGDDENKGIAGTYTVKQAELQINIISPENLTYSGQTKEYSASTETGVTVDCEYYKVNNNEELEPLDSAPVDAGVYVVKFILSNPNFYAGQSNLKFTIEKRLLSISITTKGGDYNGLAHEASISFGNVAASESLIAGKDYTVLYKGTLFDISDYNSQSAPVDAGNYTVTVQVINPNYEGSASQSFTINKVRLTVKAKNHKVQYGDELPTLGVEYIGFVNGENEEVLKGELVFTTRNTASPSLDIPYAPGASAGTIFEIKVEGLSSNNYAIYYDIGHLTVTPREISVAIKDQEAVYTGSNAVVIQGEGADNTAYKVVGGEIFVKDGKPDRLDITVSVSGIDVGIYAVKGVCGNPYYNVTFVQGSWQGDERYGTFTVKKAPLTVTANTINVQYGNEPQFGVSYKGLVNNEQPEEVLGGNVKYITSNKSGGGEYIVGAEAGSKFTVTPSGITAKNYEITFTEGELTVVPRVIGKDEIKVDVGGNGQYTGTSVDAVVSFEESVFNYGSVTYDLSYEGEANDKTPYPASGIAPIKAGNYTVKVTLTNKNYQFVSGDSDTFDYVIAKQERNISWTLDLIYSPGTDEYTNELSGFDDSIMAAIAPEGVLNAQGTTLTLTVTGIGRYSVSVRILEDALYNYKWSGIESDTKTVFFSVSAQANAIEDLQIEGWTFGNNPNQPTFKLLFGDPDSVIFEYGVYVDETPQNSEYGRVTPVNAGKYWLHVIFVGDADFGRAEAYVSFEIYQKTLTAPVLNPSAPDTFTGEDLVNTLVGFDGVTMGIQNGKVQIRVDSESGELSLIAFNHGEYTVTITLKDLKNYKWEDGSQCTLTWVVKQAKNSISDITFAEDWIYGETPEHAKATSKFGSVKFAYAPWEDVGDYSQLSGWQSELPVNAGKYVICAYSRDDNQNYTNVVKYKEFTIGLATIKLDVENTELGYVGVYDARSHAARMSGNAITVNNQRAEWFYSINGSDWVKSMPVYMNAGKYDVYYKVTATNHTELQGMFTAKIDLRPVVVAISDASSVYGDPVSDLNKIELSAGGLAGSDKIADLNIVLQKEEGTDAGKYRITGTYQNSNYQVTFIDGEYTITPKTVTIEVVNGGGTYGGEIKPVEVKLKGVLVGDVVLPEITYVGNANNGTEWNSNEIPELAGTYTAIISLGGNDIGNYLLADTNGVAFIVARAIINAPEAESKEFTGEPLTSSLADTDIYTVTQGQEWINVGTYKVILTLKDNNNYRWESSTGIATEVQFRITKADNEFTAAPEIEGWTFGEQADTPQGAKAKFGNIIYKYSSSENGVYTELVSENAGVYWVRAFVEGTENYASAESDAVSFTISKRLVVLTPDLRDFVYSGSEHTYEVGGFDPDIMQIEGNVHKNAGKHTVTVKLTDNNYTFENRSVVKFEFSISKLKVQTPSFEKDSGVYDGKEQSNKLLGFDNITMAFSGSVSITVDGSNITAKATNSGTYTVTITLKDTANHEWANGQTQQVLTWTVQKKLLAKPSASTGEYVAQGSELVYLPEGFDSDLMNISGNRQTDAGDYTVTVSLKDAENYAWQDGSTSNLTFSWTVAEGEQTLTWLVITLSCVVAFELILMFVGIARRRRMVPDGAPGGDDNSGDIGNDGNDGDGDNGGSDGNIDGHGNSGNDDNIDDDGKNNNNSNNTDGIAVTENDLNDSGCAENSVESAETLKHPEETEKIEISDENSGENNDTKLNSFAPCLPLLTLFASVSQETVCIVLGAVAAALAIIDTVIFFKKKKAKKAAQPEILVEPKIDSEPEILIEPEIAAEPEMATGSEIVEEPETVIAAEPEVEEEVETTAESEVAAEEDNLGELAVADIPDEWKEGIGAKVLKGDVIYFRYNYSFQAKLIQSSEEVQRRYGEICDEIRSYPKLKTVMSWRQVRVYCGRKTVAVLVFKGKKICVAYALDPNEYKDTKYRGEDLSGIKRYEKTPMLLRLTSARREKYAKHLLAEAVKELNLKQNEVVSTEFKIPYQTTEELIRINLIKVLANDKRGGSGGELVRADIAALIRERITLVEAQSSISDEVAATLLEDETKQPEVLSAPEDIAEAQSEKADYNIIPLSEVPRSQRGMINIDTLSQNFASGETVTLEVLKEKKILPKKVIAYKVLARGVLDKSLTVEAQDFSIDAIKMISLTGGRARKVFCKK